jgi:hypothetical protein
VYVSVCRICSENLVFFLDADDYRRCVGSSYRLLKASRLFEKYIGESAEMQVNLPSAVTRDIENSMSVVHMEQSVIENQHEPSVSSAAPLLHRQMSARSSSLATSQPPIDARSHHVFIAAQREVFFLLQTDGLKPFLNSTQFKQYKQQEQFNDTT